MIIRYIGNTIDAFVDLILTSCENSESETEGLLKGELTYRVMLYFTGGKILGTTDHVKCGIPEPAKIMYFLNRRNVDFKFTSIRNSIQKTSNLSQSKKEYMMNALDTIKK